MSSRNKRYDCKWRWLRNFPMILKTDCSMQNRVLRCSLEFSKKFSERRLCSVSFCQLRYLQTLFKPCPSATHSIPVSSGRCSSAVKGTSWLRRFAKVLIPQSDKQITTNDLKKFLTENNIRFEEGYTCLVIDCQLCHLHGHRYGNPGKLFINRTTGMFLCLRCQNCGSWQDLQDYLSLLKMGEKKLPAFKKPPEWLPSEDEIESLLSIYSTAKSLSDFDSEELQEIFQNFAIQNLSSSILEKYDVRIKTDLSQLLFPIYAVNGKMVGLQVMNAEKISALESVPRNLIGVLFGWKQLNAFKHSDTIIIAAAPFDVMAIAQEVKVPVVSLPQEKYLPLEVLPLFEPYHKVIFWLGNNMASWELAKMLARKLNDRRCFIIRPQEDHPTPLEALRLQLDISKILKTAHAVAHKAITTFHTLRQDVFSEICHTEQVAGVKWKRYPLLTRLLKGHRHGELTVFTGPTGSGKTTFMSEYSLDLCMQGIRTLWGSFEIRNSRLAKMMLTQFALIPLDKHLDQYDYWADKFEQLPLYFMTFHGSQSIRSVLDAMRHAVYVHDIEHVIVDNLQFMMGTSETPSPSYAFDRFWRQDIIVSSFRQFATVHNCHVTLVIHPRKENSDELNNMSIFGGAKASQEADNVLILQDRRLSSLRGRKYIQVTKNRYDGELGICPLDFDRETLSYVLKKKPRKSSKLNIPVASDPTSESTASKPAGS